MPKIAQVLMKQGFSVNAGAFSRMVPKSNASQETCADTLGAAIGNAQIATFRGETPIW
jgi:hypothetical protein